MMGASGSRGNGVEMGSSGEHIIWGEMETNEANISGQEEYLGFGWLFPNLWSVSIRFRPQRRHY